MACINLPHLAVALEERDHPQIAGRPFAIEAPSGPRVVYDLSAAAHETGVRRAMTLAQARKVCPEITIRPPRPEVYQAAFEAFLSLLTAFTPAVEPADLERSWLSTDGLVAQEPTERLLAQELADQVRHEMELVARVGMAHGKLTSQIVTQCLRSAGSAPATGPVMVLPRGREVSFLSGLAVAYLPLEIAAIEQLLHLGLTKIRQFAALPSSGILPRFGYPGLRAYLLAHGQDDPRVMPYQETPFFEAHHALLEPLDDLAVLNRLLDHLAERLAQSLEKEFRMARTLSLSLVLENGLRLERQRTMDDPTVSARALAGHAATLLADVEWSAPVERIALAVQGLCPTMGRQLDLFHREQAVRQGVARTLRQLQAKFGEEVVQLGHPLEPTSALPERRAYTAPWQAA